MRLNQGPIFSAFSKTRPLNVLIEQQISGPTQIARSVLVEQSARREGDAPSRGERAALTHERNVFFAQLVIAVLRWVVVPVLLVPGNVKIATC